MTIKTRNRTNIALCIISAIILVIYLALFIVKVVTNSLSLEPFHTFINGDFFLTKYNPYCVIFSLFILNLYVIICSYVLYRSFEKTQASDIVYFSLFLIACLIDTFRIFIPLFDLSGTYSRLLIACGNATLFSELLIPISLMFTVTLGDPEYRQDLEKNSFVIILSCFFFAGFIPLNTAITNPNFAVEHSFKILLHITTVLLFIISVITLIIKNVNRRYSQTTTIGFAILCPSIILLHNSVNMLMVGGAMIGLGVGTSLFLIELHKQYLWND